MGSINVSQGFIGKSIAQQGSTMSYTMGNKVNMSLTQLKSTTDT